MNAEAAAAAVVSVARFSVNSRKVILFSLHYESSIADGSCSRQEGISIVEGVFDEQMFACHQSPWLLLQTHVQHSRQDKHAKVLLCSSNVPVSRTLPRTDNGDSSVCLTVQFTPLKRANWQLNTASLPNRWTSVSQHTRQRYTTRRRSLFICSFASPFKSSLHSS